MTKVVIADQVKSSLVMTSEIFKDKIPGCTVFIAKTGLETIQIIEAEKPDMAIIDFDLPDVDGISLTHVLRKIHSGPILMTAYPDKVVTEAVNEELFAYDDVSGWIKKPVKFDSLAEKITHFLIKKRRLTKRYDTDLEAMLVGKGAGRGKRAPKVSGNMIKISMNGALVDLEETSQMKIGDEITVNIEFPVETKSATKKKTTAKKKTSKKASSKKAKVETKTSKFKATIAWTNKKKNQAGVEFALTDSQKKQLESTLRSKTQD